MIFLSLFIFTLFNSIAQTPSVCVGATVTFGGINPNPNSPWSSNNTNIATVSNTGVITGIALGSCTITFTDIDGDIFTSSITVTDATSTISLTSAIGTDNQTVTGINPLDDITYSVNGSGCIYLISGSFPTGVTGSFSNGVFTISGTPLEAGTFNYTLSVTGSDCGFTGNNVTGTIVSQIAGVCSSGTYQLPVIGSPALVNPWVSLNPTVATVSSTGLVTGVLTGDCDITYTDDNANSINYTISVNNPIVLDPILGFTTVCVGKTSTLYNPFPNGVWSSSNILIATVNANGLVTGVSTGSCDIIYTVTVGGCSAIETIPFNVQISNPPTITLTSAVGTDDQFPLFNYESNDTLYYFPIVPITYAIGGGATSVFLASGVNSLPNGVTGVFSNGVFTISGTPIVVMEADYTPDTLVYNYRVRTIGGTNCLDYASCVVCCETGVVLGNIPDYGVEAEGTITLNPPCFNTITGTSFEIVCGPTSFNTSYNTTATGVSVTGLPSGLSSSYSNGVVTVSGFLSDPGSFTYNIETTGSNCVQRDISTTIQVDMMPILVLTSNLGSDNQTVCSGSAIGNISYNSMGTSSSIMLSGALPNGVTGLFNGSEFIISGTPTQSGSFSYSIMAMLDGICPSAMMNGTIIVSPSPVFQISGANEVCVNSAINLSATSQGGTWSTSNATIASIDSDGILIGISGGTITASYTLYSGNCSSTQTMSIVVNDLPEMSPITGQYFVCDNSSIELSNTTTGGVWSSSNTAYATVTPDGVVSGVLVGSVVISYSKTVGNCTAIATRIVYVSAAPIVNQITGDNVVCAGSEISLSSSTLGGAWSSSNTSIATVELNGVVTGVSSGTVTITYTKSTGNCTSYQTKTVTVNALPVVTQITGQSVVCENSTVILSNTTVGGVWSSSNTNIATVTQNGLVATLDSGTVTISYTVTSICSASQQFVLTVNPLPVAVFTYGVNNLTVQFDNNSSNADLGYVWDFGVDTSITENPSHIFSSTGNYTVVLYAENQCGIDSTYQVIGISDLENLKNNEVAIYPNPFNNQLTILLNNNETTEIIIYDLAGKIVFSENNTKEIIYLNLESIVAGQYLLKINQASKSYTKMVTKK